MAEGFETRQVIDSKSPSGGANQPVRQLGLVSVQAPRGGSIKDFGKGQEALAQAVKMGSAALDGYLKKKDAEAKVTASMELSRGKTLADLEDEGANNSVLDAFQTLSLRTAATTWEADFTQDAENKFATMDPKQFADDILKPEFTKTLDGLDPTDARSREVFTAFGEDSFARIVAKQQKAHTAFKDADSVSQLSNLLHAGAQTGDASVVQDDLLIYDEMAKELHPDNAKKAMLGAMIPQLREGNFLLYDQYGGSAGLVDRGYSVAQVESVRGAVEAAQVVREDSMSAEAQSQIDGVLINATNGLLGPTEAEEEVKRIQETYRFSDDWMRGTVRGIRKEAFEQTVSDDMEIIRNDPDYMQHMAQLAVLAEGEGNTKNVQSKADAIAAKFKLPRKMVKENVQLVQKAHQRRVDAALGAVRKHNSDQLKKKTQEIKASSALKTDTLYAETKEVQQLAMTMKREEILSSTANRIDGIKSHVQFLRKTSVIDNAIKRDFTEASAASPVADGQLTEAAESSLDYFIALRQGGVSETTIKKYTGDAYDYFSTAAFLQNGSLDPTNAMAGAWEITRTPKDARQVPITQIASVKEQVGEDIDDFYDDIEPGVLSAMFGAASDGKYDEIMTDEVTEAAKNSAPMRAWALKRAETYAGIYPNMRPDAISDKVKRDLGRWEYVLGTMVAPTNGQSFSEMIGIADMPEGLASNTAVLSYVVRFKDELMPEGSDPRGMIDKFVSDVGAGYAEAILAPEKFYSELAGFEYERGENTLFDKAIGAIPLVAAINSIDARQRILKKLPVMDVTPQANGMLLLTFYDSLDSDKETPLMSVPVRARAIGEDYRNVKNQAPFE